MPRSLKLVALLAITAALGWQPSDAAAAPRRDAPQPAAAQPVSARDVDLEELFWLCDYAASTGMVDAEERAACGAATDQLRLEQFGGDSEQMLRWWRANKAVRHQQLERDEGANAAK
jgi:hypothetical protein